jgi:hypothetical protein
MTGREVDLGEVTEAEKRLLELCDLDDWGRPVMWDWP